jgi:lipoyl-dependent peroxiredoxin
MIRKAKAVWRGTGRDGDGDISTDSGVLHETPYSYRTRFENEKGTNPEELIAAAHAGCFSMALSAALERAGHPVRRVSTTARVHLEMAADGPRISRIDLHTEGVVPGIDDATFQQQARQAKEGCPVSKALAGTQIELEARLLAG